MKKFRFLEISFTDFENYLQKNLGPKRNMLVLKNYTGQKEKLET